MPKQTVSARSARSNARANGTRSYRFDENAATETAECKCLLATTKNWKQCKAMRNAPPRGRMPEDIRALMLLNLDLYTIPPSYIKFSKLSA